MKAWCHSCRKEQSLNTPKKILHQGRKAIQGTCSKCKTEIISYDVEEN